MRIAQLTARYSPSVGGVQTHVRRLAEECAAAGDEVTVLTHQFNDLPAEELLGPVRVLRFPRTVTLDNFPFSRQLFRYLRCHSADFDVVHAHDYHTVVGQAAAGAGLPFVFTPHYHGTGHTPLRAMLHPVYRPWGGRLFAAADAVVCVSQAERALVARDFPEAAEKIRVLPNGTQPRARPARGNRGAGGRRAAGTPTVLAVGRLERYKNVDLVIRAFAARGAGATLVIVGEGPDRPRLERLAALLGAAGRVRFRGRVSGGELAELLDAADVVTSASSHEAFGLVVADALAAGARVVASDIPAHLEVGQLAGDGAPVTFVDPADTAGYAAALAAALDLGPADPGIVRLPSWADVAGRTRELYARACAMPPQLHREK